MVGTVVVSSSFQGTSSMSISMMRTFGSTAHRLPLVNDARWL
jgi:hypothetical protein